jgi:hypothetical protein
MLCAVVFTGMFMIVGPLGHGQRGASPVLLHLHAQIYAAKGDRANMTAQLRTYLKFATDPNDAAAVRNYLAKLEGQTGK